MRLSLRKYTYFLNFFQTAMLIALFLLLIGLDLELLALQFLFGKLWFNALLAHLAAAVSIAISLYKLMPHHKRTNLTLFLLFTFCLLIPIVSGICLLLIIMTRLYLTKPVNNKKFYSVDPLTRLKGTMHSGVSEHVSNGRIKGILCFCQEQEKRIKAVLATRQLPDEKAIPLLRIALLDAVDEVRLLAYSMLDSKRKNIDLMIHKGLTKLKGQSLHPVSAKLVHQSLAEAFWELSYLGLVEGRSRQHALNSAKQHVLEALKINNKDAGLHLLQARISVSLGLYEEAQKALQHATNNGIPAVKLAPFYAEIAFENRRFSEIPQQLKHIDKLAQKNVILGGLVAQWC